MSRDKIEVQSTGPGKNDYVLYLNGARVERIMGFVSHANGDGTDMVCLTLVSPQIVLDEDTMKKYVGAAGED